EDELSQDGLDEAAKLGVALQDLTYAREIEIYSSPARRALQTAEIACKHLNLDFQTLDQLDEVSRPSIVHGKKLDDAEIREVKDAILENVGDPNYRHSDEETFFE